MRRWLVFTPVLIALLLVLAACQMGQPGAPGAPAAATPATVETDTPTPAMEEEATETPELTGTEEMTETVGITVTPEMTATEEMTGTPEVAMTPEATETVTGTAGAAMEAVVMVTNNPEYGDILTDGEGRSLYLFTQDTPNTSTCTGGCLQRWPPLTTAGEPRAGSGVDAALLGVITRDDGTQQVTYNGWPLYYFANDQAPGDTNGHEVGDVWYLVTPEGERVGG